jgi:phosphatidylglycerol---prolipoprotein diacylglyceryl transferase
VVYPVLFHLGTLPVPTHEFFTVLGLLVATGLVVLEARRRRVADRAMATIAAGALLGAAIGARLGNWWLYLTQGGDLTLPGLLVDAGKSVLGGLAGAYLGVVVTKRLIGYSARTGDVFAPAVALGLAVGRVGCFLTEQIGTPTSLPWGFTPPVETLGRIPNCPQCQPGVAMHPSFVYEIAFFVGLFVALQWLRPHVWHIPGELFKAFLASYCVFRFAVEFVRGNPEVALGLTRSQWFLLATGPLIAWYFLRQVRSGAYRPSAGTPPVAAVPAPTRGGSS